jgi:hypothetical protein
MRITRECRDIDQDQDQDLILTKEIKGSKSNKFI